LPETDGIAAKLLRFRLAIAHRPLVSSQLDLILVVAVTVVAATLPAARTVKNTLQDVSVGPQSSDDEEPLFAMISSTPPTFSACMHVHGLHVFKLTIVTTCFLVFCTAPPCASRFVSPSVPSLPHGPHPSSSPESAYANPPSTPASPFPASPRTSFHSAPHLPPRASFVSPATPSPRVPFPLG